MEFFNSWIANILIFILLAAIVEMLLPQTSLQKYVKLVLGLLLMIIILKPIMSLFTVNPETLLKDLERYQENEGNFKKTMEYQKKEIQAQQAAYILEQMAVHLKEVAEDSLPQQYGLEISDLQLEAKDQLDVLSQSPMEGLETLKVIKVSLKPYQEDGVVEAVKDVIIDTGKKAESAGTENFIKGYLAGEWGVDPEIIEISIEKEAGRR